MSTPEAIEHLIEFVRSMHKDNFAISATTNWLSTTYNEARLRIRNRGFSSSRTQQSLHFQVDLEEYQQAGINTYSVWIYNPSADDPAANRAAVIACLEELMGKERWKTQSMVSKIM